MTLLTDMDASGYEGGGLALPDRQKSHEHNRCFYCMTLSWVKGQMRGSS